MQILSIFKEKDYIHIHTTAYILVHCIHYRYETFSYMIIIIKPYLDFKFY